MADERPSLQPRAQVLRSFFPRNRGLRGTRLSDLPEALQDLSVLLGDDLAGTLRQRRDEAIVRAQRALAANPRITREELVEELGGHRTIARRLLRQQEGRQQAQQFAIQTQREYLGSAIATQGPEAARDWLAERQEAYFRSIPEEADDDFKSGALEGIEELQGRIIGASVATETDNILQGFENNIAQKARTEISLSGGVGAVQALRGDFEAGDTAGLDLPRARQAVISSFGEMALSDEFLFDGEEILTALTDGADPFIKDPQERNQVAELVRRVRAAQDVRMRADQAAQDDFDELEKAEAINTIGTSLLFNEKPPAAAFDQLVAVTDFDEATKIVARMQDNISEIQAASVDEETLLQVRLKIARGELSNEEVATLPFPAEVRVDLLERNQKGQSTSVFSTPAYRRTLESLTTALANDLGDPFGADAAQRYRAFDLLAAEAVTNDPALLERAQQDRLLVTLQNSMNQALAGFESSIPPSPSAELSRAGAASRFTESAVQRAQRRRDFTRALNRVAEEDAFDLGESRGLRSALQGQDPFMQNFWHLPPPDFVFEE